MSNSFWPYELQLPGFPVLHRLLKFAQTHVHWVSDGYLTISSAAMPFSSCPQSFQASGSFPTSQLFASGGESIGASGSASVLPMNIQGWFPLVLTGWISLQSRGLSSIFSSTTTWKLVNAGHIHLTNICLQMRASPQSCLWNPMNGSMLGFPVLHSLLELAQTHFHRVSDAIQPTHLLSSPSPPAFNLSQWGSFQWRVSSSLQEAKVLEL